MLNWNEEALEIITYMALVGHTSSQIAETLSQCMGLAVTRNAVMGALRRKGVKLRPSNQPRFFKNTASYSQRSSRNTVQAVIKLAQGQCRWPIGEPQSTGFRFCCVPVGVEQVYCPEHKAVAYLPTKHHKLKSLKEGQWTTLSR
jgi:GcrA cell cycle regulator